MAASENRVLTSPLAIIKVGGIAIGKMKNISINESLQRARVVGIGSLTPSELPVVGWNGTISCEFFTIDLKKSMLPGAINRMANSIDQFVDTVLLQEDGVQIDIMRKAKDPLQDDDKFPNVSKDPNYPQRIISSKLELFASVKGAFLTREGFNISEGAISGRNVEMEYTTPIIFPI